MQSTAGYGATADALAAQYESVTFEEVHRETLHLYPLSPAHVLDLGAGTGRDAAALARRGHQVVAAEPTQELRALGEQLHQGLAITWVDDALPCLDRIRASGAHFDLVLATAVWMHLDVDERVAAITNVAEMLAPDGLFILSLRHGPVPHGRRMFDVSAQETLELGTRHGLTGVLRRERADMLGRPDVTWSCLALRAAHR